MVSCTGRRAARSARALAHGVWASLGFALAADPAAASAPPSTELHLKVHTPVDGATVADAEGLAFIAGSALAHSGKLMQFDVMFVVDRSSSTRALSGGDIDRDGRVALGNCGPWVPRWLAAPASLYGLCPASKDSIFSAELTALRTLLRQLDPRTTRVGVVYFDGDGSPDTPDAHLVAELTREYAQVEQALGEIERLGPAGRTHLAQAVEVAALELIRNPGGPPQEVQQIILLLSDGTPTLPEEDLSGHRNTRISIESAQRAGKMRIRVDTYAVGADALDDPTALAEMARVSGGIFTPVEQPHELQSIFEQVQFTQIEQLRIRNLTAGREAEPLQHAGDGTFSALISLVPGPNRVELYGRSSDGSERTHTLELHYVPEAAPTALAPRWLPARNRLLEARLESLRRGSLTLEQERDRELRRELRVRIEQARERAQARVRELRIESGAPAELKPPGAGPSGD